MCYKVVSVISVISLVFMLLFARERRQYNELKHEHIRKRMVKDLELSILKSRLEILKLENDEKEIYDVIMFSDRVYRDSVRSSIFERYLYLLQR